MYSRMLYTRELAVVISKKPDFTLDTYRQTFNKVLLTRSKFNAIDWLPSETIEAAILLMYVLYFFSR